jgi:hypothetical protein
LPEPPPIVDEPPLPAAVEEVPPAPTPPLPPVEGSSIGGVSFDEELQASASKATAKQNERMAMFSG